MPTADVIQERHNLIDSLVSQIATVVFADTGQMVDQDHLAGVVDAWLPQTYAEAEAETKRLRQQDCQLWIDRAQRFIDKLDTIEDIYRRSPP